MDAFERQKKHLQWIYDLEYRLAVFLCEHPESESTAMVRREETALQDDPREIIEVKDLGRNWWAVYRNGQELCGFFGADAQRRASRFASDLLNHSGSSGQTNLE